MEYWATYTFIIDGKEIKVVAKNIETAKLKANKEFERLYK